MPTRRTSPRRSATRPTVPSTPFEPAGDDDPSRRPPQPRRHRGSPSSPRRPRDRGPGRRRSSAAAGADLDACRTRRLDGDPRRPTTCRRLDARHDRPQRQRHDDLDPGPAAPTARTNQPVVYASVTCYGDVAATALTQNRAAAEAAGATVTDRGAATGDAYDVDNASTGSVTTLFRVGGLIGQVADAGSATPADLAVDHQGRGRGDGRRYGGRDRRGQPSDAAAGSQGRSSAERLRRAGEPSVAVAPELEATLPTTQRAARPLTVQSASAARIFGTDPNSRAPVAAAIRTLGAKLVRPPGRPGLRRQPDPRPHDLRRSACPVGTARSCKAAVIETWLSGTAAGVKQTEITLGGQVDHEGRLRRRRCRRLRLQRVATT